MSHAAGATTGSLAKKPLAHLFVYAFDKQLTGSMELAKTDGSQSAVIVFARGEVAKIRTSVNVAYLGAVLYELGTIDEATLNMSLHELAKQKRPQGQILLEQRAITREQLADGLREQTLRKLAHLFSFGPETSFTFRSDVDLLHSYGGGHVVLTDPYPAIWRGIREFPSMDHVRDVLARVGAGACRLARGARVERFHLAREEAAAVDCLRMKAMTVAELDAVHLLPPKLTALLVYCLLITRQLEIESRSAPPRAAGGSMDTLRSAVTPPGLRMPQSRTTSRTDLQAPPRTISAPSMPAVRAPSRTDLPAQRTNTSPSMPAARTPSRSDMPGVDPISFNLRVTPAVRLPSSAAHARVQPGPPGASSSRPPAAHPSSKPPGKRSSSRPPPSKAHVSSMPPTSSSSSNRVAVELASRAKAIHDRARDVQREDHFQRLSLPRDATMEQVERAYTALTSMWDPHGLPPALESSREDCAIVVTALTEAFETLIDSRKRSEYVKNLRVGTSLLPPTLAEDLAASGADNEYDGAKKSLAKGDMELAERLAKRAQKAKPDLAGPLALLAWIEAQKSSNQGVDPTRACIVKLDRAVKLDPYCEEAFYYRAQLHKRIENHPAAMKDLKRVTTLNPGNVEAERELRIYEMRVRRNSISMQAVRPSSPPGAKAPTSPSGLFDRLLKK
jgi:hypothetical protein